MHMMRMHTIMEAIKVKKIYTYNKAQKENIILSHDIFPEEMLISHTRKLNKCTVCSCLTSFIVLMKSQLSMQCVDQCKKACCI